MKQHCKRERIVALLTLALLLAGLGPTYRAYAANIVVTTFDDNLTNNGDCSLREAIQAANTDTAVDACPAGSGADTIQLSAGSYVLSLSNLAGDENANQTGDLDILGSLTIKGVDSSTTNISTTVSLDRLMQIPAGSTVTLTDISISNGHSAQNGGAIANSGTLTLNGVVIKKNTADGDGGGIFNDTGTLVLNNSLITDNQAQYGGGIFNNSGILRSNSSQIAKNVVASDGGGIFNGTGTVNIDHGTLSNNQAHNGAGIFNNSGAAQMSSCIVNNNETVSSGDGGGIYNNALLVVDSCWIHDNQPVKGNGAGIYNTHTATIIDTTIADNYATLNGGNIYNGNGAIASLTMKSSEVRHGYAIGNGGGIYNGGALSLTNITITTNRANLGDGMYNISTALPISLTNTTIVSNTDTPFNSGEGIYNASNTPIELKNTLVAYNGTLGDCAGPISSAGYNLEYNLPPNGNTCTFTATGDLTGTNPLLGPFDNYGGKTSSYALLPGSPAINAGTNVGCPATDQRNVSRPRGPSCDIGAYESNDKPSTVADAYTTDEDIPLVVGQPGVLGNDTDPDNDALTASLVSQPAHGVLTFNANGSFSYTPDANYHGLDSFSYRASDGALSSSTTVVSLTVNSVNDPPIALADAYSTDRDTPLTISQPGVLGNDTDVDGDPLTATLVSGPAHGALTLNANGSFTYTPTPSYTGPDSFSYRAGDSVSLSGAVNVALTVRGQNSPPVAGNDTANTSIDTPLLIPIAELLSNDSDPDGDPLSISDVRGNSARGGRVMLSGSNVVYTPPLHFSGVDSLIYTLSDGNGGTASGTVTVAVGMRQLYLPTMRR